MTILQPIEICKEYIPEDDAQLMELYSKTIKELIESKVTVSTAESCTGGLLGKLITDIPGSSSIYYGGIISYTNEVKINVLGVSPIAIEEYTEVSDVVAGQMAERIKHITNSDVGISTTGFAGPGGGTDKNPLGTVYVGIANSKETVVYRLSFPSDSSRKQIRNGVAMYIVKKLSIYI